MQKSWLWTGILPAHVAYAFTDVAAIYPAHHHQIWLNWWMVSAMDKEHLWSKCIGSWVAI